MVYPRSKWEIPVRLDGWPVEWYFLPENLGYCRYPPIIDHYKPLLTIINHKKNRKWWQNPGGFWWSLLQEVLHPLWRFPSMSIFCLVLLRRLVFKSGVVCQWGPKKISPSFFLGKSMNIMIDFGKRASPFPVPDVEYLDEKRYLQEFCGCCSPNWHCSWIERVKLYGRRFWSSPGLLVGRPQILMPIT